MAGCCWFPTEYQPHAFDVVEMAQQYWWHNHGEFYVDADYFVNQMGLTQRGAIGNFMSGRPEFFPVSDRGLFTERRDIFGDLRDAISRLLFHPSGRVDYVTVGNQMKPIKSFDALQSRNRGSHGGTVHIVFVIAPWFFIYEREGKPDLFYGWNTSEIVEAMAPGKWRDYSSDRNWSTEDWVRENVAPWIRTLALQRTSIITANLDDHTEHPSVDIIDVPPLEIYRQEFYMPELTQDGGEYYLETDIYRAFGAQRLRIQLSRQIEPYQEPAAGRLKEQNKVPHYFIGVRQDSHDAARLVADPPLIFYASLVDSVEKHEAADDLPSPPTIANVHEFLYGGRLTNDIILRVNDEVVDITATDLQLSDKLRDGFQNVQDYSPPTEFTRVVTDTVPSEIEGYRFPSAALESPAAPAPMLRPDPEVERDDSEIVVPAIPFHEEVFGVFQNDADFMFGGHVINNMRGEELSLFRAGGLGSPFLQIPAKPAGQGIVHWQPSSAPNPTNANELKYALTPKVNNNRVDIRADWPSRYNRGVLLWNNHDADKGVFRGSALLDNTNWRLERVNSLTTGTNISYNVNTGDRLYMMRAGTGSNYYLCKWLSNESFVHSNDTGDVVMYEFSLWLMLSLMQFHTSDANSYFYRPQAAGPVTDDSPVVWDSGTMATRVKVIQG